MIENRPWLTFTRHTLLIIGIAIVAFPLWVTFVASTLTAEKVMEAPMQLYPGSHLLENYEFVLGHGSSKGSAAPVGRMMYNSLVMALTIAIGKIAISLLSAFAIVFFKFRFRMLFFWMIFVTLMLPVEVRILPTYKVVADLGMINTYAGLTIPLIASATATFLFRQFFLTFPTSSPRPRASTAQDPCAFSGMSWCRCRAPASRRCSSSSSSTAGISTCGHCSSPPTNRCTRR